MSDGIEGELRDAGIELALGGTPAGWQVDAINAVRFVAERQSYLDADDVWEQLTAMGARTPATKAALAGVLKQASGKKLAWIEATDTSTKSDGEGRHKSRIMVWRSLIHGRAQAETWDDVFAPTVVAPGRRENDQPQSRRNR